MKNYLFYVGIDISKSKLDVVVLEKQSPNVSNHFIVENNLKGIKEILKNLIKQLEFRCVRSTNNETPVERNRLYVLQLWSYRKVLIENYKRQVSLFFFLERITLGFIVFSFTLTFLKPFLILISLYFFTGLWRFFTV